MPPAKDLFDRTIDAGRRVSGVITDALALNRIWADNLHRLTVTIDVIHSILGVIFFNEDRRSSPVRAVGDGLYDTA
jgi:hypothetical protein